MKTINVIVYLGVDENGRRKRALLRDEAKRSPFKTFSAYVLHLMREGASPAVRMAWDYIDATTPHVETRGKYARSLRQRRELSRLAKRRA